MLARNGMHSPISAHVQHFSPFSTFFQCSLLCFVSTVTDAIYPSVGLLKIEIGEICQWSFHPTFAADVIRYTPTPQSWLPNLLGSLFRLFGAATVDFGRLV
eukprot:EG_transcript_6100